MGFGDNDDQAVRAIKTNNILIVYDSNKVMIDEYLYCRYQPTKNARVKKICSVILNNTMYV